MEYLKIPNIYKRETFGKNRLIDGEFSSEELGFLKACQWSFTEKVDRTNTRVIWDGHRVSFAGRTDRSQIPKHLMEKLEELFGGETKEELFEQTFGVNEAILFGEGFGEKIQKGGDKYGLVNFILFDVYINGYWLSRENVIEIASVFEIDVVPEVLRGNLQDGVDFISTHPKSLLKDDEMEGVVGRPVIQMFSRKGERIMVKIKCKDFPIPMDGDTNG